MGYPYDYGNLQIWNMNETTNLVSTSAAIHLGMLISINYVVHTTIVENITPSFGSQTTGNTSFRISYPSQTSIISQENIVIFFWGQVVAELVLGPPHMESSESWIWLPRSSPDFWIGTVETTLYIVLLYIPKWYEMMMWSFSWFFWKTTYCFLLQSHDTQVGHSSFSLRATFTSAIKVW